jgi:hypothetical protein
MEEDRDRRVSIRLKMDDPVETCKSGLLAMITAREGQWETELWSGLLNRK